jgi:hypothetical protein
VGEGRVGDMATELRGSAAILDLNPLADVIGSRQGEGRDQGEGQGPVH